jgi:hypothetical protein
MVDVRRKDLDLIMSRIAPGSLPSDSSNEHKRVIRCMRDIRKLTAYILFSAPSNYT